MDDKLFKLCREVFAITGWGLRFMPKETIMGTVYPRACSPEFFPVYQEGKLTGDEMFDSYNIHGTVPQYSSDYLLQKLNRWVMIDYYEYNDPRSGVEAFIPNDDDHSAADAMGTGETLQIALLTLIVNMADGGVKF